MSQHRIENIIVTTDNGSYVVDPDGTYTTNDTISMRDPDPHTAVESALEYISELAHVHTAEAYCGSDELRIAVRDEYVCTTILTDLVGLHEDISFSTAISTGENEIEVTISVTGTVMDALQDHELSTDILDPICQMDS